MGQRPLWVKNVHKMCYREHVGLTEIRLGRRKLICTLLITLATAVQSVTALGSWSYNAE